MAEGCRPIPRFHPDIIFIWLTELSPCSQNGQVILDDLSDLKVTLVERYGLWLNTHRNGEADPAFPPLPTHSNSHPPITDRDGSTQQAHQSDLQQRQSGSYPLQQPHRNSLSNIIGSESNSELPDLTGLVTRSNVFPSACGGFADVWEAKWGDLKVAVKVIRSILEDEEAKEKLKKVNFTSSLDPAQF